MTEPYSVGTVSVANGGTTVTGTSTFWVGKVRKNDLFTVPAQGLFARITADPTENDELAINAWPGDALVDAEYEIISTYIAVDTASRTRELLLGLSLIDPNYDVQVGELVDRAAYDDRPGPTPTERGFAVLVSDIGDGRSAIYSKASNTSADWTDPAYVTGPVGPAPVIEASITQTAPGTAPDVDVTPITGGYGLEFELPLVRGAGFQFQFATATADENPGAGLWRANHAGFGSATQLFISKTSDVGADVAAFLEAMGTSTSPNKGTLVQQRLSDGATASWVVAGVTDATGYVKVAVSGYSGPSAFAVADLSMLQFMKSGNAGAGTGDVVGPTSATDGAIVAFDGPTGELIKALTQNEAFGTIAFVQPTGRVSLSSAVALTSSDIVGAGAIYLHPMGMDWTFIEGKARGIGGVKTLTLSASHAAGTLYDLFDIWEGGAVMLVSGPAWANSAAGTSSRGSGAGTTEIEWVDGLPVNKNAMTVRNGASTYSVAARAATLRGTFRTVAAGQTEDSVTNRLLSNAWNAAPRKMVRVDPVTTSWAGWGSAGWRWANGSTANQLNFVQCLSGQLFEATAGNGCSSVGAAAVVRVGVGLDSGSVNSADILHVANANGTVATVAIGRYSAPQVEGYHFASWLEDSSASTNVRWFGSANSAQNGIIGEVFA